MIVLLAEHVLAGDLALNLVQPLVQVIQILAGLAELLLNGLLFFQIKRGRGRGEKREKNELEYVCGKFCSFGLAKTYSMHNI